MSSLAQLIQERWREELVPIFDGILYADGRIARFSYDEGVRMSGPSSLAAVLGANPDYWTSITEHQTARWGDLVLHCGGGGLGADGFVAATRADDGTLAWLMFSQRSNPFTALEVRDNVVRATTNVGHTWELALPTPDSVAIA